MVLLFPRLRAPLSSIAVLMVLVGVGGGLLWWRGGRQRREAYRYYLMGVENARAGRTEVGVRYWEFATRSDPSLPEPAFALADFYRHRNETWHAAFFLEQLRQHNPDAPHLFCRLAELYLMMGDKFRALRDARAAARKEPNCPRAHAFLGMALTLGGASEPALDALQRAHRLAPGDVRITLTLAQVQLDNVRLKDAERTLRLVLKEYPDHFRAHYLMGWLYAHQPLKSGKAQLAIEHLRQAIRLNPNLPEAHVELGRVYLLTGQLQQAKAHLEKGWRMNPYSVDAAYNLAQLYRRLGDKRATQMQRTFLTLSARSRRMMELEKRLSAEPKNIALKVELAQLYLVQQMLPKATLLLRSALEQDPEDEGAIKLLLWILRKRSP